MTVSFLRPLLLGTLVCASTATLAAPLNVQILSATVKDKKIEGAEVILQRNGAQSIAGTTDATGKVQLGAAAIDDAAGLLIVKKSGYSDLVVKCPCNGLSYALSPEMVDLDGLRIVLNWGASPSDLDSHLVYPNNHVFFSQKKGDHALLDVDDTDSYGPETTTIKRKKDGQRYVYAVHNFTDGDSPDTDGFTQSDAKVFVYVGKTLIRTYYVPKNQKGNLWTLFAITESGEFQDFNTIKGVTSHERLQTAEFQSVIDSSSVLTANVSDADKTYAKQANRRGEEAFHTKNFDDAITQFQRAIEFDSTYGQAYSNLGLAFQKAGRVAEALWANRKAIALASGATAPTVRASSFYNNGRIYEDAGQWLDALNEYQNAKREKANPVYDKAILRMQAKGAN